MSVTNHHPMLHNIPDEKRSHVNVYSNNTLGRSVSEMANQCLVTMKDVMGIQVMKEKTVKKGSEMSSSFPTFQMTVTIIFSKPLACTFVTASLPACILRIR
jgi:hypothetical protein